MECRNNKIIAVGFAVVIGVIALIGLISPDQKLSESENRTLQSFPEISVQSVWAGKFTSEFEKYVTDQFPFRDQWMGLKSRADLTLGKRDNGKVYFGKDGYLFPIDEIDARQEAANLAVLGRFLDSLNQQYPHLKASILIAPTSSGVLEELLPKNAPVPPEHEILSLIEKVTADANQNRASLGIRRNIVFSNPESALKRYAKEGEYIYYRTDHHWTSLGAYIAYRVWAQDLEMTPIPQNEFQIEQVSSDFYGTTQSKTGLSRLQADSIERYQLKLGEQTANVIVEDTPANGGTWQMDSLYVPKYLKTKDQYSYFLGGNHPKVTIETKVKNGKTLLLIKDSYAHCFVPFLTSYYQKIVMVDLRYFKEGLSSVVNSENVTDIMLLFNVVQFASDRNLAYLKM